MRLNPDCVRDVLMAVEANTSFRHVMEFEEENFNRYQQFKKYTFEEVAYHLVQCNLSGYFTQFREYTDCSFAITDLSPKGHEFLANIRNDNNWKKIKDTAQKIGSFSLSILADIAKDLITSKF